MFEEYLEDSYHFAGQAFMTSNDREARRYYRVAIFCAMGALESFVNYIADMVELGERLQCYEIAYLVDKQFSISKGEFSIQEKREYHRIEDKLRLLICNFIPDFNFQRTPCWSRLLKFKKFRDNITHPREDDDEKSITDYKKIIKTGLPSVIEVMNYICKGVLGKSLRKKILDLKQL